MQTGSLVCVGLDSDIKLLPDCLKYSENPIWEFNRRIIDSTQEYTACYKPNLAFYLADGLRGLDALIKTLEYIPSEIPTILDCKVGDIGNTMDSYVWAFLETIGADSITVNPLMGRDVLNSLAKRDNSFGFVLSLTSNPSAADFLLQQNLCEHIAEMVTEYPKAQMGCVVGATQTADLARMRKLLPQRIFLIPGIGAQGGDLEAVMKYAVDSKEKPDILINSSRGIIFRDHSTKFDYVAGTETRKLKESIEALL